MVRKAVDSSLALAFILVFRGSFSWKLPWVPRDEVGQASRMFLGI
jgi:hypothetical protein